MVECSRRDPAPGLLSDIHPKEATLHKNAKNGKAFRHGASALAVLAALTAASGAQARTLTVGPGKTYAKPSLAAAQAANGDTVLIEAGLYAGDVAFWDADNLVLKGRTAFAHLRADGQHAGGKGIWVIQGKNTTVENVEFSGAKVPDENGAGIRQEGPGLTVRNCYFHDNENGILGGGGSTAEIVIEGSEFANNGFGDGYTHNMYIDEPIKSFTLRSSTSRLAKVGHLVKSRARVNYILYNRIMDEAAGTSSYQVDLPNGGAAYIIGNVIQQGPANDNPTLVAFAMEGNSNPQKEIYLVNNTFVNDHGSGAFVSVSGSPTVKLWNNLFVGPGSRLNGAGDTAANLASSDPGFVDRAKHDYRLTAASPAIDKGRDPGAVAGFSLSPAFQFAPGSSGAARPVNGALDIGAFEYSAQTSIKGRAGPAGSGAEDGSFLRLSPEDRGKTDAANALGREADRGASGAYWKRERGMPASGRP